LLGYYFFAIFVFINFLAAAVVVQFLQTDYDDTDADEEAAAAHEEEEKLLASMEAGYLARNQKEKAAKDAEELHRAMAEIAEQAALKSRSGSGGGDGSQQGGIVPGSAGTGTGTMGSASASVDGSEDVGEALAAAAGFANFGFASRSGSGSDDKAGKEQQQDRGIALSSAGTDTGDLEVGEGRSGGVGGLLAMLSGKRNRSSKGTAGASTGTSVDTSAGGDIGTGIGVGAGAGAGFSPPSSAASAVSSSVKYLMGALRPGISSRGSNTSDAGDVGAGAGESVKKVSKVSDYILPCILMIMSSSAFNISIFHHF
jgi:hypothetical protein